MSSRLPEERWECELAHDGCVRSVRAQSNPRHNHHVPWRGRTKAQAPPLGIGATWQHWSRDVPAVTRHGGMAHGMGDANAPLPLVQGRTDSLELIARRATAALETSRGPA